MNKVVVAFTIGKRTLSKAKELLHEVRKRSSNATPYFTSDELEHYIAAIREEYGVETTFPKTGKRGRPKKPIKVVSPELIYSQVHKYRENGKIQKIETHAVFGTDARVEHALHESPISNSVNISLVERNNLTLRQQNGRLHRKTLQFSKEKELIYAQLSLFLGYYHFIRPHQGLRVRNDARKPKWRDRTPMMAVGITDHPWTFREFFTCKVNLY